MDFAGDAKSFGFSNEKKPIKISPDETFSVKMNVKDLPDKVLWSMICDHPRDYVLIHEGLKRKLIEVVDGDSNILIRLIKDLPEGS